jgi:hypothetical protein
MELNHRRSQLDASKSVISNEKATVSSSNVPMTKNRYLSFMRRICLDQTSSDSFLLTRIIFIRLLGLVYTFSFLAAYHQTPVLIGYQGLYPAYIYMQRIKTYHGLWQSPSLFYFLPDMDTCDLSLRMICGLGIFIGLFILFTGRCNTIMLIVVWCFQTSLLNIGQVFYGYVERTT